MTIELNQKILQEAGIGNFFRPSQLEPLGITYRRLRQLEADAIVERVDWGVFRIANAEPTERYSKALVCARVPNAVVCLLSALQVYEIGTQLPRQVWIAIPHKARPPSVRTLEVRLLRFSGAAWTYGIQKTSFEAVPARITSPARTIVDCFRFRRLIGQEAALEVLPSRRLRTMLESGVI